MSSPAIAEVKLLFVGAIEVGWVVRKNSGYCTCMQYKWVALSLSSCEVW